MSSVQASLSSIPPAPLQAVGLAQGLLQRRSGGQVLISSYQLTRTKAPHWVRVTGCDEDFVYLHDPDIDHSRHRQALDCQHMPVSHARFQRMRLFGGNKLRASVLLYPPTGAHTARRIDSSTSSAKGTER